ncbi:adenosine 3'-phospho 5'-phosphosulfate transporter 2 [Trichogramma pretiosum]|uniref:adenosine 3'-phospho 5'-phosphosulfate transporter 2 n=1 Tax=Trichogramma pretiosum TaxID=7493 RepID=UPI0006C9723F|nr:adenosine 3'-phospho 5'-phosphosulfate transporter 2 [Trichogramma pretiosum]
MSRNKREIDYQVISMENGSVPKLQQQKDVKLFCFDLSDCSTKTQVFWCSIGIFTCYIIYGYLQELIFTLDGFRPFGWYLTLIQFAYYTIFGWIECKIRNISRKVSISTYLLLALLTLGTMGFSNSSLGYLNYPTQVIFKCCKLIPVLIGSIIIQKKRYGWLDFFAASLMCFGLILFTLADSMISPRFDIIGVVMISCALLCDALIGNIQEKTMKKFKAANAEIVLYSYSIGFVYLFIILLLTGDFFKGTAFCVKNPVETYGYALLFSISGYLGIQVVLSLVQSSGAFVAATVTTCRKAVTIIISFFLFYKPFTSQYIWSGLLVVIGIYLNIYSKQNPDSFSCNKIFKFIKLCVARQNRLQKRLLLSNV